MWAGQQFSGDWALNPSAYKNVSHEDGKRVYNNLIYGNKCPAEHKSVSVALSFWFCSC